ncbi:pantoate--beta-alanine ligase [Arachidicoccus terrestris]|uniref:pantoate--beta-alanine ligase n=1 Tax=Arachidicoccus terrestris TaxID=2875539 RepID=UPI001CC3F718|nr:pantoate--beta-alanine ligase [Arachidicoccus terrestris]UAY56433.1 pantoate--beta-alanine ligase [Arachidicoccus terrestris]
MIILKTVKDLTKQLEAYRDAGKTTGFVPTMGALHEGHLSLIREAKAKADITICSIFVNPTQFNDPEDFKKYPVTTGNDIELLLGENVDLLFLPSANEMYPKDLEKKVYPLGPLEMTLEGAHRPGHFQGVAQVIDRLVGIIQPTYMVMGQKDFQQVMIVRRLLALLKSKTALITGPTLREPSGLAKSSRNTRLTAQQLNQAAAIYQALLFGKETAGTIPIKELIQQMEQRLLKAGFAKVDYVAFYDPTNLSPLESYTKGTPAVILVAAFLGDVRLIDNITL